MITIQLKNVDAQKILERLDQDRASQLAAFVLLREQIREGLKVR